MQKRDEGGDAGCDAMKEVTLGATAEVRGVEGGDAGCDRRGQRG